MEVGPTAFKELLYKEDSALGKVKMQLVEQQRVACGREAQEAKQQQEAHAKIQMKQREDSVDRLALALPAAMTELRLKLVTWGFSRGTLGCHITDGFQNGKGCHHNQREVRRG